MSIVGALFDAAVDVDLLELRAGEVLVEVGAPGTWLHRVTDGRLEATATRHGHTITLGQLGPGDVVGEVALLTGGVATATVTATEDVRVERLPLDVAQAHLAAHPEQQATLVEEARDRTDRAALLLLLARLLDAEDGELLAAAAQRSRLVRVPAGTVLLREGETGDTALLVVAGRLGVETVGPDGPIRLARLGRGQVVGEAALLTGEPRSATVTAVRDSVVAEVDRATFHELLASDPRVLGHVMSQLVRRATRAPGSDRPVVSTLAVASLSPATNTRVLTSRIAATLGVFGPTTIVTPATVDRALGTPGAADAGRDDPSAARVATHLHEQEATNELVLLEVGTATPGWTRRALGTADRVVLTLPGSPDAATIETARTLLADVPAATTTMVLLEHAADVERPTGTAALRDALGVDDVLHLRAGRAADLDRAARLAASRGVAVVLGGGGARGFAHLGVLRALEELGVPVDLVVGASIGAPMAGGVGCGLDADQRVPLVEKLFTDLLDYTIPMVSLIKGERIAGAIRDQFDDWDIEDMWVPFRCVSTNLTTSRVEVHDRGPAALAVRASVSIPGVMPPVPRGEDLLVDGGLLDNLPVDVAAADGRCATIIAVDVAPPRGPRARDDYGLSVSGWEALKGTLRPGRSTFPGITAVLMRSMLVGAMANRERAIRDAGVDLLLELPIRGVGLLEFDNVRPVADQGHQLALPLIEAWLAERGWRPRVD